MPFLCEKWYVRKGPEFVWKESSLEISAFLGYRKYHTYYKKSYVDVRHHKQQTVELALHESSSGEI